MTIKEAPKAERKLVALVCTNAKTCQAKNCEVGYCIHQLTHYNNDYYDYCGGGCLEGGYCVPKEST